MPAKRKNPSPPCISAEAVQQLVLAHTREAGFSSYLGKLLMEICKIDTTPNPDVNVMRDAEDRCFKILERELKDLTIPQTALERHPINPTIQKHENFSLLHFTKTTERPKGLTPEKTYAGRCNLLCQLPGEGTGSGKSVALNAHIDVVAPFFPPKLRGGTVFGRGSCDDKASIVSIVAALRILSEVLCESGLTLKRNVLAMFVIEEETGGNGSLSLAIDRELKKSYDSILVGECTDLVSHPANRGAVWYRAELKPPAGVSAFEMFSFVNEEMERTGTAIRSESRHALFPQRPVQTCHGMIGSFGEHPSRICGEVAFTVEFSKAPDSGTECLMRDCLDAGLADYVGLYGDKSKVDHPATGKPMVAKHYDVKRQKNGFLITVHGATGHMGAIRERDGAITKMAHLVRSLIASRKKLESFGGKMRMELAGANVGRCLVLEGGQGFLPTHGIGEVMDRLRQAAERGAGHYLSLLGKKQDPETVVKVTYEKLHNVAFDGDPDSFTTRNAIASAKTCGIWKDEPVLGWTVSCDSRLFATEYPGMEVLTFGPGLLAHAHSDQEQVEVDDVRAAVEFLTLFILRQTGTLPID